MERILYVIQSRKGYLCDVETYTTDPYKAATFVDPDTAFTKLTTLSGCLSEKCHVNTVTLEFPRKTPLQ